MSFADLSCHMSTFREELYFINLRLYYKKPATFFLPTSNLLKEITNIKKRVFILAILPKRIVRLCILLLEEILD